MWRVRQTILLHHYRPSFIKETLLKQKYPYQLLSRQFNMKQEQHGGHGHAEDLASMLEISSTYTTK